MGDNVLAMFNGEKYVNWLVISAELPGRVIDKCNGNILMKGYFRVGWQLKFIVYKQW